jgi:hypothetical protein
VFRARSFAVKVRLDDALHSTDADDLIAALNILTKAQKDLAFNRSNAKLLGFFATPL